MLYVTGSATGEGAESCHIHTNDDQSFDARVIEIVHDQVSVYGLKREDAHEIHCDMDFVRNIRQARGSGVKMLMQALLFGIISTTGFLLALGLSSYLSKGG